MGKGKRSLGGGAAIVAQLDTNVITLIPSSPSQGDCLVGISISLRPIAFRRDATEAHVSKQSTVHDEHISNIANMTPWKVAGTVLLFSAMYMYALLLPLRQSTDPTSACATDTDRCGADGR